MTSDPKPGFKIQEIGVSLNPETYEVTSVKTRIEEAEKLHTSEAFCGKGNAGTGLLALALFVVCAKIEELNHPVSHKEGLRATLLKSGKKSPAASLAEILQGNRAGDKNWVRELVDVTIPENADEVLTYKLKKNATDRLKSFVDASSPNTKPISVFLKYPHPKFYVFFDVHKENGRDVFKHVVQNGTPDIDLPKAAKKVCVQAGNAWRGYALPKNYKSVSPPKIKVELVKTKPLPDNENVEIALQIPLKRFSRGNVPVNEERIKAFKEKLTELITEFDDSAHPELLTLFGPIEARRGATRPTTPNFQLFKKLLSPDAVIPKYLPTEVIIALSVVYATEPSKLIGEGSLEKQEMEDLEAACRSGSIKPKRSWLKKLLKSNLKYVILFS